MTLKKTMFKPDEIAIFDEAIIYKRDDVWQMRIWLAKERKYARFSLKTRNQAIATDKAKLHYHEVKAQELAGKTYFSKTTKWGVEQYVQQRQMDCEAGLIVKGRVGTIKTHLGHWLDYIGRDTKLKELERTDAENYFHSRSKTKKQLTVSQTTIANEQSTINAMMAWLYKRKETHVEAFDFKPLKRLDRGDEGKRRGTFDEDEMREIAKALEGYVAEGLQDRTSAANLSKVIVGYYLLLAGVTGLRRGEQLQLRWKDVEWLEKLVKGGGGDTYSLVKITVRGETSKVRKTRKFVIKDLDCFDDLMKFQYEQYERRPKAGKGADVHFGNTLVFSLDGVSQLTARAIGYHFDEVMERADIADLDKRDLVPYSFRHYFITSMINRGASPTQVAETCGTSTHQIEQTYYHTTEAKMITNALPQYEYRDGLLIPK